mmetsp:Transcript_122616/g.291582  ORF Transcript_122616/g.291582 Transcript_122616/m.291582 type:complete len:312 (-) Transcript_122616:1283-2218(-)
MTRTLVALAVPGHAVVTGTALAARRACPQRPLGALEVVPAPVDPQRHALLIHNVHPKPFLLIALTLPRTAQSVAAVHAALKARSISYRSSLGQTNTHARTGGALVRRPFAAAARNASGTTLHFAVEAALAGCAPITAVEGCLLSRLAGTAVTGSCLATARGAAGAGQAAHRVAGGLKLPHAAGLTVALAGHCLHRSRVAGTAFRRAAKRHSARRAHNTCALLTGLVTNGTRYLLKRRILNLKDHWRHSSGSSIDVDLDDLSAAALNHCVKDVLLCAEALNRRSLHSCILRQLRVGHSETNGVHKRRIDLGP